MLFAVVTLAALLGAGGWLLLRPVVYRATAKLLVTSQYTNDASWQGLSVLRASPGDPALVFESAAMMIDSPRALARTAGALGPGWTPGRVSSALTIKPDELRPKADYSRDTLAIQVRESNARLAVRVAQVFARTSLQLVEQAFERQASLRLTAGKTYGPEQQYELRAVLAGFDPTFSLLGVAKPQDVSTGGSPFRMLSLSLIPAIGFGLAAVILAEAVSGRRSKPAQPRTPEIQGRI